MMPGMATTTFSSDGWVPGSTVTVHLPVAVGQSPAATIDSQVADSDGGLTFDGLTPGLSYIAISGARRASFTLPDLAGEYRSQGVREPDATIIANLVLGADESAALLLANGKGFCLHGAVAGTARPSGFASIEWVGTVEPSNAVNGDTWIDTT